MPVKLSDELVLAARHEASTSDRSITSQIEHWAKLGRAAEAALSHADVLTLKVYLEDLMREAPARKPSRPARMKTLLLKVARSKDRKTVLEDLREGGTPLYEADPEHPDLIVRIDSDGSRAPGRFEGKRFIPLSASKPRRKAK
jgi:hypothetical protein